MTLFIGHIAAATAAVIIIITMITRNPAVVEIADRTAYDVSLRYS